MNYWHSWVLIGAVFSLGQSPNHRWLMWLSWIVAMCTWAETMTHVPIN